MVARVRTVAFSGVEVVDVEAQVTITAGLPAFAVVGLPDKAVAESRERVRSALAALGLSLPSRHITKMRPPMSVSTATGTCPAGSWPTWAQGPQYPPSEV